jgi:hypothetical protein
MVVPRAMYLKFQDGPFSVRTTHGWLAYPVAGTCKCIPWKWLCHRERLVNSTMALSQVQYVFSLTEVLVHSSTVSNRQALHPIKPFRTPRRATLPKWSPVHGLDECNHHHYGCSREACGGGLHSMAHGYATVRVNSQSDALYCPGYSRGIPLLSTARISNELRLLVLSPQTRSTFIARPVGTMLPVHTLRCVTCGASHW